MIGVAYTSVLRGETTVLISLVSLDAARHILSPPPETEILQFISIIGVGIVESLAVNADIHTVLVCLLVIHGVPRIDSHRHHHVRVGNRRNNGVDSRREVPVILDQAVGCPGAFEHCKISRRISRSWINRRFSRSWINRRLGDRYLHFIPCIPPKVVQGCFLGDKLSNRRCCVIESVFVSV